MFCRIKSVISFHFLVFSLGWASSTFLPIQLLEVLSSMVDHQHQQQQQQQQQQHLLARTIHYQNTENSSIRNFFLSHEAISEIPLPPFSCVPSASQHCPKEETRRKIFITSQVSASIPLPARFLEGGTTNPWSRLVSQTNTYLQAFQTSTSPSPTI